ncbi:MAG: hypothetical protein JWP53_2238 [Conexibacter sp.]|jgi:hypothetical protein|nr:hypothetical protein [Conexibacter sp.]
MGTAGARATRLRAVVAAARRKPYRNAIGVTLLVVVLGGLFVTSYGLALGRPKPHHIDAVISGDPAIAAGLVGRLERNLGGELRLRRVPSAAAARQELLHQRAYAGLALGGRQPRLLVASATGASVARVLTQAAEQIEDTTGPTVRVEDVRPLSPKDPQGLVMFYAMLAATIAGFILTFQLRANAPGLPLRAWLGFVVAGVTLGGLTIAIIAGPILGALGNRVPILWVILSTQMAIAALVNSTNLALLGGWAILPTWLLFVIVGNAASGGAVAPPLLPPVYAFVGRWLPSGATVEALRNVVYFSEHDASAYAVLAGWLVVAVVALAAVHRVWGKSPNA